MKLEQLIDRYQKELGLERPFSRDSEGGYIIHMADDLFFTLRDIPPAFGLTCEIGECPRDNPERFYTDMMVANLFGQGTEGAVLGLGGSDGNTLTLSREIEYNVDYEQFKEILEDFMTAIDLWRSEAQDYKPI